MGKFAQERAEYKRRREEFAQKYGQRDLWFTMDQWPLYVGQRNLGRYMAISDLLRSTLSVPGHVAEFGSWRGANLMFMAKLLRLYDPHGSKIVHCFESFEGLTTFTDDDGAAASEQGTYRGNHEELVDIIRLYNMQDDIVIHKGLIQDTLPDAFPGSDPTAFSFVYCDTDLYEPTNIILNTFHPRLAVGGLFVLDEWNYSEWPGETRATNEFLETFGDCYEVTQICNTNQPSLALRKTKY